MFAKSCCVPLTRHTLLALMMTFLLVLSGVAAPLAPAPTAHAAAAFIGDYSPNTRVEMRGEEVWFVRPPYESRLLPTSDGVYVFEAGWLAGRVAKFVQNNEGGISILIRADDSTWNEFARSGEIYTDLDPALRASLAQMLEDQIRLRNLPGAVLYVHIAGQGEYIVARGVANRAATIPAVPLDRWRIASISKTFLAVTVLRLVDQGALRLDDTVEQWLPGVVPNGANITVRQLLNHTSGLYNYMDGYFIDVVASDPSRWWSPYELVDYSNLYAPHFAPGTPGRWKYSNTNYVLLGLIVERATGTTLAQAIHAQVIDPLGLSSTHFEPDEDIPGRMHGYVGWRDISHYNLSFAWACGSMESNGRDLGVFMQALMHGQLLSPQATQELLSFVPVNGEWYARYLTYGLGLMRDRMSIARDINGNDRAWELGYVVGHTGALAGYRSALWYQPDRGITIAVGTNQMYTDANSIVTEALNTIYTHQERTGIVSVPDGAAIVQMPAAER